MEKAALGEERGRRQRADTKLYRAATAKRWHEERAVKEAEGLVTGRGGGAAPECHGSCRRDTFRK